MTKREINEIKSAAYEIWAKSEKAQQLLKTCSCNSFITYEISEIGKTTEIITVTQRTQVNSWLLKEKGFSENATVKQLFIANRQTKCLEYIQII